MPRLPIPLPSKYPAPGAFPMGGVAETRKAPLKRGGLFLSLAPGKKRAPSVVSENALLF